MKVKDIKDTVFKCDCGCGSELAIGEFGDGRFTFAIKQTDREWNEVVIDAENIKKIVELLKT